MNKMIIINDINIKDFIEIVGTFAGLYISYIVYKLQKKESNPKITINHKFKKINTTYIEDDSFFDRKEDFKIYKIGNGFTCMRYKESKISCIEIKNKGEFPATNLKLELCVDLKKGKWDGGIDEIDMINPRMKKYMSKKIKYNIEYIPPGDKIIIYLFEDEGQFIGYDIRVKKLKSNECKFIKKDTIIKSIKHEGFNCLSDSNEMRNLYGCRKLIDNYDIDDIMYI